MRKSVGILVGTMCVCVAMVGCSGEQSQSTEAPKSAGGEGGDGPAITTQGGRRQRQPEPLAGEGGAVSAGEAGASVGGEGGIATGGTVPIGGAQQGGDNGSGGEAAAIGPTSPQCNPPGSPKTDSNISWAKDCTASGVCEFSGETGGQPRFEGGCSCKGNLSDPSGTLDFSQVIDASLPCLAEGCLGGGGAKKITYSLGAPECARFTTGNTGNIGAADSCGSLYSDCHVFDSPGPTPLQFRVVYKGLDWFRIETANYVTGKCPLSCP